MKRIQTIAGWLVVATALTTGMTACTNDDNDYTPEQPAEESGLVDFTATITLDDGAATTRALSGPDSENSIQASWVPGEHVAVVYKKGSTSHDYVVKVADATVTAKSNKSATISTKLNLTADEVNRNSDITLIYPYSAVITSGDGIGQVRSDLWANQTGTLADISQYRDLRSGSGTLSALQGPDGISIKLKSEVTMSPQAAIWKLTLNQTIDATHPFSITDADSNVLLTTVTPADETSEVYIAMAATTEKKAYVFSVTKNGTKYRKKGKAQLEAGKFYQTTLTLDSDIWLSEVTSDHIGYVVGSNSHVYSPDATLPSGVSKVAMICYVSSEGHGMAIELNDSPQKRYWDTSLNSYPADISGGTWRIPSVDDWNKMIYGCRRMHSPTILIEYDQAKDFINSYDATGVRFCDSYEEFPYEYDSYFWTSDCFYVEDLVHGETYHKAYCISFIRSKDSCSYSFAGCDTGTTAFYLGCLEF